VAVGLQRADRGLAGGILSLVAQIDAHPGAFEYDWRTRFHLPLSEVGSGMEWGEAYRLARVLRSDPSSQVAAALEGWDFPIERTTAALLDLFDLEFAKGSKKPKTHPGRPWKTDTNRRRFGDRKGRSRDEIREVLNRYGHNL
jgi:hypothetical protein